MKLICSLLALAISIQLGSAELIKLLSGVTELKSPIIISRPNTVLEGYRTTLRIADNANCPAIIVESTATNSSIQGVTIDGNRLKQTNECWSVNPHIRNNGISIQGGVDITVSDVAIYSCRSGGIVATDGTIRLLIDNVQSSDNQFDGIAAYDTKYSTFKRVIAYNNLCAGLSVDWKFDYNNIIDCKFDGNDIGIFMRDSSHNTFTSVTTPLNVHYAVFQSSRDGIAGTECVDNVFIKSLKVR